MNDDKQAVADKLNVPPIWVTLLPFGTVICAGFAAYETFHLRTGLWWGLGAGVFLLLSYITRALSSAVPVTDFNQAANLSAPFNLKQALLITALILGVAFIFFVTRNGFNNLQVKNEVFLKAETIRLSGSAEEMIICPSDTASVKSNEFENKVQYQKKKDTCSAETKEILKKGTTIEGKLYANRLDDFFALIREKQTQTRTELHTVDIALLPDPLLTQLNTLLPKDYQKNFTAFDVALASKRINDVATTMPTLDSLLPHQRHGLFSLGLYKSMSAVSGETEASLLQRKIDAYESKKTIAVISGSSQVLAKALLGLINDINTTSEYSDFKGGYTSFDYYMANRSCDLPYALFLDAQGIQPVSTHILHLLSIIGHVQYPNLASEFQESIFTEADDSLELPTVSQLDQCVELAKFYAKSVKDFNESRGFGLHGNLINNYYSVYSIADSGVFQWRIREWYRTGRDVNRTPDSIVQGDPAILINAAAEILKAQPPSFDQYCAWASSFYSWTHLIKAHESNMFKAMQTLPSQWKGAKTVYMSPDFELNYKNCNLSDSRNRNDKYHTEAKGISLMNAELRKAGIPCQGIAAHRTRLTNNFMCNVKTVPWPVATVKEAKSIIAE